MASKRTYVTYTGKLGNTPISATSTGIGCPATAIAVEELAQIGAKTLIRVGSSGALHKHIKCGDLVISTGAVRNDGTSRQYISSGYPAVAGFHVVLALVEAAESLGYRYHVGITCSTDSFYTGQGRPGFGGYWQSYMSEILSDLRAARVLNFEMECATLFTLANLFGLRSGAVCAVFANRETDEFRVAGEDEACRTACEAAKILSEWDAKATAAHKPLWYPSLR
jgi:uridine phosphorylase